MHTHWKINNSCHKISCIFNIIILKQFPNLKSKCFNCWKLREFNGIFISTPVLIWNLYNVVSKLYDLCIFDINGLIVLIKNYCEEFEYLYVKNKCEISMFKEFTLIKYTIDIQIFLCLYPFRNRKKMVNG